MMEKLSWNTLEIQLFESARRNFCRKFFETLLSKNLDFKELIEGNYFVFIGFSEKTFLVQSKIGFLQFLESLDKKSLNYLNS